jgi:uncharacterized repeat protein (TIGR01451 family)
VVIFIAGQFLPDLFSANALLKADYSSFCMANACGAGRFGIYSRVRYRLSRNRHSTEQPGSVAGLAQRALAILVISGTLLFGSRLPVQADATITALTNQSCAGTRFGSTLGCTANDFTATATLTQSSASTLSSCIAGQPVFLDFVVDITSNSPDRYDGGVFFGQVGNDPTINNAAATCSLGVFPLTPFPFFNDTSNTCGDYRGPGNQTFFTIQNISVLCKPAAGTNTLSVPYAVVWANNSVAGCNASTITAATNSKCLTGSAQITSVAVQGYVQITKQTNPDGSSQPFSFSTSANPVAAVNPTTFTLNDGQSQIVQVPLSAIGGNQTLVIDESLVAGWNPTAAITCTTPAGGSAASYVTVDTVNRRITATLNAANYGALCTITNTQLAKVTLQKNIASRIADNDQFVLSVSDGTAVTATTSGSATGLQGVSASKTVNSGTALSLTESMAAGSSSTRDRYLQSISCTNSNVGSPTPLPSGSVASFPITLTPTGGDDITCTITNAPKFSIVKSFSPKAIAPSGTSTITFTLQNNTGCNLTGITFTDTFPTTPSQMVVANPVNNSTTCSGAVWRDQANAALTAGDLGFRVNGISLNNGASCTVTINATIGAVAGSYGNYATNFAHLAGGACVAYSSGAISVSNTDTLLAAIFNKATISKSFTPATIDVYDTSTMTFTLTNPNGLAMTNANFTDTLTGFSAITPIVLGGTCSSVSNSGVVPTLNLTVPSLPPGSCTIAVPVTGTVAGSYNNTTSGVTTAETGAGNAGTPSNTATLAVNFLPLQVSKAPNVSMQNPGGTVDYVIGYRNPNASTPLKAIVITDPIPPYTTYLSASCGPLPSALTSCTISAPPVGGTGTVTWTLGGDLNAGSSGTVNLSVRIK